MLLLVEVVVEGDDRPPVATPLRVEIRDTSLADTEAPLVAEGRASVASERSRWLQNVELEIPDEYLGPRHRLTASAHIDVDGDGAISPGDYLTTRSFPVPVDATDGELRLEVQVQRI